MLPAWVTGAAPWLAALPAILAWVLSYTAQVQLALALRALGGGALAANRRPGQPCAHDHHAGCGPHPAQGRHSPRGPAQPARGRVIVTGNALIAWPDLIAVAQHTWPPLIGAYIWLVLSMTDPAERPKLRSKPHPKLRSELGISSGCQLSAHYLAGPPHTSRRPR